MSSINPHFTQSYSQPEEYHFSHDSVFLSRKVFEIIRDRNLAPQRALDLCAGCGVIGLDLMFHLLKDTKPVPEEFDFVEVQEIYEDHFQKNVSTLLTNLPASTQFNFLNQNYAELRHNIKYKDRYDLILCNPPYFRVGQGKMSPSEFKNRCRFFIDSDFSELIRAIEYTLSPTGKAFILIKSLEKHGVKIEKELQALSPQLEVLSLGLIRTTDLFEITKKR